VSFVAQAVDWAPEMLYDIVKAAYHHRGLSFVRIVQRCPEWLPQAMDPWMNDPSRVQVLHHADGLQPSASTSKLYKNQLEHDPMNIDRAREIAGQHDVIPVGILYRNPSVPCYETLRRSTRLVTPEFVRTGLNEELDKYTVWPDNVQAQSA
jgi:2-oxoglutarate/2-oxoacid ferredoxin oxidoreductase subunit beta